MELSLKPAWSYRVATTSRGCTGLLHSTSTRLDKVVVGDHDGSVTCLHSKGGKPPQETFVTPPGTRIGRLQVSKDRVFVAANNEVRGFSKKGKNFYFITTFMSEPIHSMYVYDKALHVTGDSIYSHYVENKEKPYYISDDKIFDMQALRLPERLGGKVSMSSDPTSVLACGDRALRIIDGQEMCYKAALEDTPTCIAAYNENDGSILYGTVGGKVGLLELARNEHEDRWLVSKEPAQANVSCISSYDLNGNGVRDILVGRDDGVVEVMRISFADDYPETIYTTTFPSAITSILGGRVLNPSVDELIVTTYAGEIIGMAIAAVEQQMDGAQQALGHVEEITVLEEKIRFLEDQVATERGKFMKNAPAAAAGISIPLVDVHDSFRLCEDDASYLLTIELPTTLDMIVLQSDIPVDMLDMRDCPAVVSFSRCRPEDSNFLLATYSYPPGVTRAQLKIRSIEGQYGTLQAYIVPHSEPKLTCVRKYNLCALSLHQRVSREIEESRPFNTVTLKGTFGFADIHSWISICLPSVPPRIQDGDRASMTYVSTFLGTQLQCTYEPGHAVFRSDNISTISILRDVIVKEATQKNMKLTIQTDADFRSVETTLQKLMPRLQAQQELNNKIEMIEPLKELQSQEGGTEFMSVEHVEILQCADDLLFEFKQQPCHLDRLYGMITDLFIDANRLKGIDVKKKVPKLVALLEKPYEMGELIDFFTSPVRDPTAPE